MAKKNQKEKVGDPARVLIGSDDNINRYLLVIIQFRYIWY